MVTVHFSKYLVLWLGSLCLFGECVLLLWVQLDVIGIDEAQFFEDLYEFCCKAADEDGKTVIVAGLDGDYLRYSYIVLL